MSDAPDRIRGALESLGAYGRRAGRYLRSELLPRTTTYRAKAAYFLSAVAIAVLVILGLSWVYIGPVDTVIYALLFVFGLTLFPVLITVFGSGLPANVMVGKFHVVLQAVAFGHHYLVQRDDKFEWCPGSESAVYVDGKMYEIEGGLENKSVLGWRPFGILRFKDDQTYAEYRVDTKGEQARGATDGGVTQVERAGFREVAPDPMTGIDGEWLIDLKRVFSRGIKRIGDIELIETAEEIIERGQVSGGRAQGWKPIIATLAGLAMGALIGVVM